MHKRSNGTNERFFRYFVNDKHFGQPFRYCECRYHNPQSTTTDTSNRGESSQARYTFSLSGVHSRPKRQLTKNLFTPNADDKFAIYRSFGDKDQSSNNEPEHLDPRPSPRENLPTLPYVTKHSSHSVPTSDDSLRKPKRLRYSEMEFVVPRHTNSPTDSYHEQPPHPLSTFHHRESFDRSRPAIHDHHDLRDHTQSTHYRNHPERKIFHPYRYLNPAKACETLSILSQIQAEYFACCDECRQKILKKYLNGSRPNITKAETPKEPESAPVCEHNKNILENLTKISAKLCELSEARTQRKQSEKESKGRNDLKKSLLQQLRKIYEKLNSMKGDGSAMKEASPKKKVDRKCGNKKKHQLSISIED